MWPSGAYVLPVRFRVTLDSARLMILGLTRMAGREKVKCEQYGPLRDQSRGLQSYLCSNDSGAVCICTSVCEDIFKF